MAKQPDLNLTIQRKILGPRSELKSLPGFWIKPKKYDVEGGEEIAGLRLRMARAARNPALVEQAKRLQAEGVERLTEQVLLEKLTPEEILEATSSAMDATSEFRGEIQRLEMRHGIGAHNFRNGGKELDVEEAIPILMQDTEATAEVIRVVEAWNRPLAEKPSESSETQRNGSTAT
jgi:hypothetical protein